MAEQTEGDDYQTDSWPTDAKPNPQRCWGNETIKIAKTWILPRLKRYRKKLQITWKNKPMSLHYSPFEQNNFWHKSWIKQHQCQSIHLNCLSAVLCPHQLHESQIRTFDPILTSKILAIQCSSRKSPLAFSKKYVIELPYFSWGFNEHFSYFYWNKKLTRTCA